MEKLRKPNPSDIPPLAKQAFDQLRRAFVSERVALVRCRYKAGGDAWVICGVNLLTDDAELVPMALLWDDDPDILPPWE